MKDATYTREVSFSLSGNLFVVGITSTACPELLLLIAGQDPAAGAADHTGFPIACQACGTMMP
jgi:hypothetical protein